MRAKPPAPARPAEADGPHAEPAGARVQISAPVGDRITLRGVSAHGYHGVFEAERRSGQTFVVDVVCWLDLAPAGASDDLERTVNYGTLAEGIVADIQGEPLNLIEALGERIARTCLSVPLVEAVEVTIHKPDAPISVEFADVAVTLTRSKT
ncbi:MAG TPA: dihydroneopterin aldolase [Propionibacteriaceae bacterium]|nr:dihydroneopterin aldolase [Propionibacteriaceae bacterium]